MELKKGIHFYICIANYVDIIEAEETEYNQLNHSIHLLHSFFSGIERFAKTNCNNIEIEKITSGRIHLFSIGSVEDTFKEVLKIAYFAYAFSLRIKEVAKYKILKDIVLKVGASYGKFFTHEMQLDEETLDFTSIGYACNFAAKLQSVAKISEIVFDCDIKQLSNVVLACEQRASLEFKEKYNQLFYYASKLKDLGSLSFINEQSISHFVEDQVQFLNRKQLGDMSFTDTNSNLNFEILNDNDGRKFRGIPFFADVRDFTSKFSSEDKNLSEMGFKVIKIMSDCFKAVKSNNGTHVQFQGDRECAVFVVAESEIKTYVNPIIAGLKTIDLVSSDVGLSMGVGMSIGKLHATRIGIRGEKDNILVGRVVNDADRFEDKYAKKNQLVISAIIYDILKQNNYDTLCSLFKKLNDEAYYTENGFKYFQNLNEKKDLQSANSRGSYNGAWGV